MQKQETNNRSHATPALPRSKLFPQFHSLHASAGFELRSHWRSMFAPGTPSKGNTIPTCEYFCGVPALLESVQQTLQSMLSLTSIDDALVISVPDSTTKENRASLRLEWTSKFAGGTGQIVPRLEASDRSLHHKCVTLVLAGHPAINAGIPFAPPSGWMEVLLRSVVARCPNLQHLCCVIEGGSNAMFLRDCIEALSLLATKKSLVQISVVPLVNVKETLMSSWHEGVVQLCVGAHVNAQPSAVTCLQLVQSPPGSAAPSQSLIPFVLRAALWGVICDSQSLGLIVEFFALAVRFFDRGCEGDAFRVVLTRISRWFSTKGIPPIALRRHLESQVSQWYVHRDRSPLELACTNYLATVLPPWVEVVSSSDSSPIVTLLVQAPAAMVKLLLEHGVDAKLWNHADKNDDVSKLLRRFGVTVTLEPLLRHESRRAMQKLFFDVIPQSVSKSPRSEIEHRRTVSLPRYNATVVGEDKSTGLVRNWSRDFPMLWFVLFGPIGVAASKL